MKAAAKPPSATNGHCSARRQRRDWATGTAAAVTGLAAYRAKDRARHDADARDLEHVPAPSLRRVRAVLSRRGRPVAGTWPRRHRPDDDDARRGSEGAGRRTAHRHPARARLLLPRWGPVDAFGPRAVAD